MSSVNSDAVCVNGAWLVESMRRLVEYDCEIRLLAGRYWYDRHSGLAGVEGQPACVIMPARLDLCEVADDASNGTSSVVINDRQLTVAEVHYLIHLAGPIWPGRYWLDEEGRLVLEKSRQVLVNLFAPVRAICGRCWAKDRSTWTWGRCASGKSDRRVSTLGPDGAMV